MSILKTISATDTVKIFLNAYTSFVIFFERQMFSDMKKLDLRNALRLMNKSSKIYAMRKYSLRKISNIFHVKIVYSSFRKVLLYSILDGNHLFLASPREVQDARRDKLELLGINSSPNTDDLVNDVKKADSSDYSYHLAVEQAVGLDKTYITDMNIRHCSDSLRFAVALSNKTCMVYNLSNTQFSLLSVLCGHEKSISNVRFSPKSENLLYTGSLDGKIRVWDLRRQNCVKELKDEIRAKPLSCFDVSFDDRFICAGTELYDGDAFILFWDVRSRKLLGGYWESHTDDLTQVAFNPEKADLVATGSTDGLINLFDISEATEDDALRHSLNTESSVSKIRWHKNNILSCLTHTEVVQVWNMEGARPDVSFHREDVVETLQKTNSDDCYFVDVHQKSNGNLFILAGSTAGKGERLKMLELENDKIISTTEFVGNRQIVRTSTYNQNSKMLFTAGESGCISVWKPGEASEKCSSNLKKMSKSRNKHKAKPY